MVHNEFMMSQVIVRPPCGDNSTLHVDPIGPTGATLPKDGRRLQLGSQDLIRVAGYAMDHGFEVAGFLLADAFLTPLDAAEQHDVSNAMVDILKKYGTAELDDAMENDFDGMYVTGVKLISRLQGLRIEVRRRGYVETSVVEEAEKLLESAWRELRLS